MKRIYYITYISIVAILCLQTNYIRRVYNNYINTSISKIDRLIVYALSDELFRRTHTQRDISYQLIPLSQMSIKERDSLMKISPPNSAKNVMNVDSAREKHVGETEGDVLMQMIQDANYSGGKLLKLPLLKHIFDEHSKGQYHCRFLLLDKNRHVTDSIGDVHLTSVYTTKLYPIGTKGLQYIQMKVSIPLSDFIVNQIEVLAASVLFMIIALVGLLIQLTTIRKGNQKLRRREQTVNGTIHDLKAPLNSISMLLEWMKNKITDKEQKEIIEINQLGVRRMISNIEALLQLAQEGHRRLALNKKVIDIPQLVEMVKVDIDRLYANKSHSIIVQNNLSGDCKIYADQMYMENVFRNLIENSLKYSDPKVNVLITLWIVNQKLEVSVKDNGWGIPKQYRKKLFKPFYRVPIYEKQVKGYGIGLAQIRTIISAHHGKIHVDCPEEGGSVFTFQIPIN